VALQKLTEEMKRETLRMTDETARVNHPFCVGQQCFAVLWMACVRPAERNPDAGWSRVSGRPHHLMKILAGPPDKRTELVGVDHEVDDERYGGQHEYQVSHRFFPAPTR
jgi:hypothetical protein